MPIGCRYQRFCLTRPLFKFGASIVKANTLNDLDLFTKKIKLFISYTIFAYSHIIFILYNSYDFSRLIDSGLEKEISVSQMFKLHTNWAKIPPFTHQCKLRQVNVLYCI